jgi:hypothetical protein
METIIKTRKPRTVKAAATHVVEMKKAMSAALKAEHAFSTALSKIERQVTELRQGLEAKREAAKAAWLNVEAQAVKCSVAHDVLIPSESELE